MPALRIAIRVGVVACVGIACLVGAGGLDDAVAVFDFRADANAAASFNERTYPAIDSLPGAARVLEDARLWMPDDARYRVRYGQPSLERRFANVRYFLFLLLWPRGQVQDDRASWVFCYGCTPSTLGPEHEILSDSGRGLLFARRRA
jgi:hypothetical protein